MWRKNEKIFQRADEQGIAMETSQMDRENQNFLHIVTHRSIVKERIADLGARSGIFEIS